MLPLNGCASHNYFSERSEVVDYPSAALGSFSRIKWLVIGTAFVVLGIVGLFLPILQGILFIVIGLMCLAKGSALVRSQKMNFKKRFPKIGAKLTQIEKKARDWKERRRKRKESS